MLMTGSLLAGVLLVSSLLALAAWRIAGASQRDSLARARRTAAESAGDLRRCTELLDYVQSAGGIGIFDLDLRRHKIGGSPSFFSLIGLNSHDRELTRGQWVATIHPDDLESFVQQFSEALAAGRDYRGEYRSLLMDGGVRWLAAHGRIVRDATGLPLRRSHRMR